jgi:hypothetical protein
MKPILKRTNINVTEKEFEFLQKKSEEQGLSMSELFRRILDWYVEKQSQKEKDNELKT